MILNPHTLHSPKEDYLGYMGDVATNPICNNVISSMYVSDYELGFGTHNYGCSIMFSSATFSTSILLTWKEVLEGRKNGTKVWRSGDVYRYVYSNFADRSKMSQSLIALMNSLYAEVYGDQLQCLDLMNCFNQANMKNQNKLIRDYQSIIQKYIPVVLGGEHYDGLLDQCNTSFGLAIKKCHCDCGVIGKPIITRDVVDGLVELYTKVNKKSLSYNLFDDGFLKEAKHHKK